MPGRASRLILELACARRSCLSSAAERLSIRTRFGSNTSRSGEGMLCCCRRRAARPAARRSAHVHHSRARVTFPRRARPWPSCGPRAGSEVSPPRSCGEQGVVLEHHAIPRLSADVLIGRRRAGCRRGSPSRTGQHLRARRLAEPRRAEHRQELPLGEAQRFRSFPRRASRLGA